MNQMSKWVNDLINPNLVTLKPYESARRLFSGGEYWLNANESPYANEYQLDQSHFNRYPACQPQDVLDGYSAYTGVSPDQILITRGADEGIELLIRTFCEPEKDNVLICPPTYGMYAISAETCNVDVTKIELRDDFQLDVEKIIACQSKPKLVFLCSPNNPTGTQLSQQSVLAVLAHFKHTALVILDEAYIEFTTSQGWAEMLDQHNNLVILRTLSKGFALAGLRCGFTLAAPEIINALLKVIAPYPIPEPVAQIAAQALSTEGLARLQDQVTTLNNAKKALAKALVALPNLSLVGDDCANFILCRTPQKQAIMDFLVQNGMLIRDQSKQLKLENCLRITVGNEEENDRLLQLLRQFFQQENQ